MPPRQEYETRLAARRRAVEELEARNRRLSHVRLVLFLAAAGLGLTAVSVASIPWWSALVPFGAFVAAVVVHDRVVQARVRAQAAVLHYERGLRRLDDAWEGDGVQSADYADAGHPCAADLDLFGRGSLFELLCRARTRGGEERLASWLTTSCDAPTMRARQAAVRDAEPRLDLREDLALLGGDVRVTLAPARLIAWGEAPPVLAGSRARLLRLLAFVLPSLVAATIVVWAATELGALPFVVAASLVWIAGRPFRFDVERAALRVEEPGRELDVLARTFERLERERFSDAALEARRAELVGAAGAIARLRRRIAWLEAQRNQVFAPVAFLLMWSSHFALAIEGWRRRHGAAIRRWLDVLSELEAVVSLASHAWEHPDDAWPEIHDQGPFVAAEDLGHPLLPQAGLVRNSVTLREPLRLMVVSGSNMSGKSTFLRTIGVAVVLARAGTRVRARGCSLSPLSIGATLRVQDSLREGASRFYAEVARLRQLADMAADTPPLLFLLDEILHGTNSHDRLIGAQAVLRRLVEAGAIGLVTTHDLALARAADELGERACNVHFADEVVDGKLHFDYRLRPGVVRRSNALELMRAVGLEV